jgi:hypothetical protein
VEYALLDAPAEVECPGAAARSRRGRLGIASHDPTHLAR